MENGQIWSTGVTVWYGYAGCFRGEEKFGWAGSLDWESTTSDGSPVSGTIDTHFEDTLEKAIDVVMELANKFGVVFITQHKNVTNVPYLYYKGDGEDAIHQPPENWRSMLSDEARRRNWISYKIDEPGFEYKLES